TPLISRRDYRAAQSRRFVDTLFGGSMSAFASALCDSGLTREELNELRAYLEETDDAH
ncbi:MAG: BlaI/MecI/CopY family transcriptional regulator, partial [Oscillospiraceae bacterium]|nr:BlaI/MecI/CopY family transcriptional regulator [Oscillospiraceae bacterium]